ncbi:hypothetical protein AX16_005039 [Volvariella volvacea WC 439]|nr:hypothetical protein AX16_005039 [Volvariella volvacea WC 439]
MPNAAPQAATSPQRPHITIDGATHFTPHKEFVQKRQLGNPSPHSPTSLTVPGGAGPSSNNSGGGLRAQLHHLLPRHAWFRVHLQIHQLASVPFVGGEFATRWKFKHAHTPKGAKKGLLGIVKPKPRGCSDTVVNQIGSGAGKKSGEDDNESHAGSESPDTASSIGLNLHDQSSATASVVSAPVGLPERQESTSSSSTASSSSPYVSPTSTIARAPSSQNMSQSFYASSMLSSTTGSASRTTASTLISMSSSGKTSSSKQSSALPIPPKSLFGSRCCESMSPDLMATPRGMTQFVPLKDHNVTWEHHLDIVVRLDIERDTHDLLPNELKLVIIQRVSREDDGNNTLHNSNPRFGALYLNLAEYAGVGAVTRRYLLSESKTNATLKITLQLDHIGGERKWIAPPLPKGEILNGVASLLDSDIWRAKPNNLNLYGPYNDQEELEMDLRGVVHGVGDSIGGSSGGGRRIGGDVWLWELEEDSQLGNNGSSSVGGEDDGQDQASINTSSENPGTLSPEHRSIGHSDASSHIDEHSDHTDHHSYEVGVAGVGPAVGVGVGVPFDVEKLPVVYGPKAAQTLIEALFNPVIVSERRKESPFTVYMRPDSDEMQDMRVRTMKARRAGTGLEVDGMGLGLMESEEQDEIAGQGMKGGSVTVTETASASVTSLILQGQGQTQYAEPESLAYPLAVTGNGTKIHVRRASTTSQLSQLSFRSQHSQRSQQSQKQGSLLADRLKERDEVGSIYSVASGRGSISEENQNAGHDGSEGGSGQQTHNAGGGGMKAWLKKVARPAGHTPPATTPVR